jgi:hypothetical protein
MTRTVAALLGVGLLWGCAPEDLGFYCEDYPGFCNDATVSEALVQPSDCAELQDILKANAVETMRAQVLANMEQALHDAPSTRAGCGFFGSGWGFPMGAANYDEMVSESGGGGGSAKLYSTTNTQEDGVDEADFVKNDGSFIYLITGGALDIYRAWPANQTHLVSTFPLPGTPQLMYVFHDRALVYSYTSRSQYQGYCNEWAGIPCRAVGDVIITVLDITNREQPVFEREVRYNGSYGGSRRIGDAVHTTLVFPGSKVDGFDSQVSAHPCTSTDDSIREAYYQLFLRNKELLEGRTYTTTLPSGSLRDRTGTTSLETQCGDVHAPAMAGGLDVVAVLSLDLAQPSQSGFTPVLGQPGTIYSSAQNLYVAASYGRVNHSPWFWGWGADTEVTAFHKFGLEGTQAATTYLASGLASGRIVNQFSMGEHQGRFHVATTVGHSPSPSASNNVFVLREQDRRLKVVGSVKGIAPSEDIRSARFVGTRGFVVTFKKTDPLFTIDLSDPEHPFIAGELHIPGFSTYIHMMDDTHLLTIGFDAQDVGSFAWFQGVALQIFDVSNMREPRLVHKTIIGTRGSASDATSNHLAFNYFAPLHVLALPMTICEGSQGDGEYGSTMSFSGLMVWDVTVEDGFRERGRVPHVIPSQSPYASNCGAWWTSPDTEVKRSIIMEDFVYSISGDAMKVNRLSNLDELVAEVSLDGLPTP